MDLRALIDGLPAKHRRSTPPEDQKVRRWLDDLEARGRHDLAERLSAPEALPPVQASRKQFGWVERSLTVGDLASGFPEADQLIGDSQIASEGMDALAWYTPFHHDREGWGIYLLDRGVWTLAKALHDFRRPPHDLLACVRAATAALLAHEYFHFLTEVTAMLLESTQVSLPDAGLYVPYREAVLAAASREGRPVEEALANVLAMEQSKAKQGLGAFCATQPHGYRDWFEYWGEGYPQGLRRLICHLLYPESVDVARAGGTRSPSETLFEVARRIGPPSSVPIYSVRTLSDDAYALLFVSSISRTQVIETKRFKSDLRKTSAAVRSLMTKALIQLATDTSAVGLAFKPLKQCGEVWSVRVGRNHRAALERRGDEWALLRLLPRGQIYETVCR